MAGRSAPVTLDIPGGAARHGQRVSCCDKLAGFVRLVRFAGFSVSRRKTSSKHGLRARLRIAPPLAIGAVKPRRRLEVTFPIRTEQSFGSVDVSLTPKIQRPFFANSRRTKKFGPPAMPLMFAGFSLMSRVLRRCRDPSRVNSSRTGSLMNGPPGALADPCPGPYRRLVGRRIIRTPRTSR